MSEQERGLGRVVYGGDRAREQDAPAEEEPAAVVEEASEESFPASDPPAYAKGSGDHLTGDGSES